MKNTQGIIISTVIIIFNSFFFLGIPYSWSEEKLSFGADMRVRYEFQDNFNLKYYGEKPRKGSADDGFLLGRFMVGLDCRPSDKLHIALWIKHADAWDMALSDKDFYNEKSDMEHNPYKDGWELSDTYIELKNLMKTPLTIKLGRQRLYYGNKRIFGPGEWGNAGKWVWDAAKISYRLGQGFTDLYYGRTMIHEPKKFSLNHRHFYESLGSYSHFKLPDYLYGVIIEPFLMTKWDDHKRWKSEYGALGDLDAYYLGLRACNRDNGNFAVDMTYIKEFGDYGNDKLNAYGWHLLLAYEFKDRKMRPRISIEYSFGSGDSDPTDGDRETFDGAFGARDKMYGRMNLFYWKNIKDAQVNFDFSPREWCHINIGFHEFRLAERKDAWYLNAKEYKDKTGGSGDGVGKEFDIAARFDLPNNNEIQLGYSHFRPDGFAEKMASNKHANWFFFQWRHRFSRGLL